MTAPPWVKSLRRRRHAAQDRIAAGVSNCCCLSQFPATTSTPTQPLRFPGAYETAEVEELLGTKLVDLYEGDASALRVLAANGASLGPPRWGRAQQAPSAQA